MGLADTLGKDNRVEIKLSDFYRLVMEGTKSELLMNAVNCDVPHRHIREMATGKREEPESRPEEKAIEEHGKNCGECVCQDCVNRFDFCESCESCKGTIKQCKEFSDGHESQEA